jgi:hypothetical protein
VSAQKLTRTLSKNYSKKFNIHLKLLEQVVVLTLNFISFHKFVLPHLPYGLYSLGHVHISKYLCRVLNVKIQRTNFRRKVTVLAT